MGSELTKLGVIINFIRLFFSFFDHFQFGTYLKREKKMEKLIFDSSMEEIKS